MPNELSDAPAAAPIVRIAGLRKRFGSNEVLKGIDLEVRPGEVVAIIGRSGSGKSTLLRCINGLETFQEGSLEVQGLPLSHGQPKAMRELRQHVGMIFQSFNLFPHLSVGRNVMLAPTLVKRRDHAATAEQARKLLDRVGLADKFDASKFAEYRTRRVSEGVSLANCNREQAYLKAMFNQLAAIGRWSKANPVGKVKPFKVAESELTYLTDAQITDLLTALAASSNPHALPCAKVCLATGARWSEGEQLTRSQVKGGKVQFARTKTDKNRSLPISAELADELSEHYKKHGKQERFFAYCEGAFREAVERAGIELPDGQMTHVLRHTFASHFMQNGGNILTLQRALGHRDLKTTMRYAHLAPDHLLEVLTLNPLAGLNKAKMPADHADPEPNQTT